MKGRLEGRKTDIMKESERDGGKKRPSETEREGREMGGREGG
jgi:hypothetical protein